jgi:hypothetical protein
MNSPTPETDVMAEKLHAEKSPLVVSYHAMRIMARRLERERDEARAMARDMRNQIENGSPARLFFPWENAEHIRDDG